MAVYKKLAGPLALTTTYTTNVYVPASALVYDVTDPESFSSLPRWHTEIMDAIQKQPFVVVGNKTDLERVQPRAAAEAFAHSIGATYVETSALDGKGVSDLFESLARLGLGA